MKLLKLHSKFLVACIALISVAGLLKAGWLKTYGGTEYDEGHCVQVTSDGNYVIAGERGSDLWILKTDTSGKILWSKTYAGGNASWIEETLDGGYVISGTPNLMKVNSEGDSLWTRDYGIGSSCVQQTFDGGYIVVGTSGSDPFFLRLIRTNENGDTVWTKAYGQLPNNANIGSFVRQTADSGFIVTGMTGIGNEEYEATGVWLLKTNSYGETVWTRKYGGDNNGEYNKGRCIQKTQDGGYIVVGIKRGVGAWLLKTDSMGDTLWTRVYFTSTGGDAYHVQETKTGEYIIVGTTNPVLVRFDNNPRDLWLVKTNQDGDTLWTRSYGEGTGDIGYCVQESEDNGYLVTGVMNNDLLLLKTDSLGLLSLSEEPIPQDEENWELSTVIGTQITLRYFDCPGGFHSIIFNTLGQKVDEIHTSGTTGSIEWGEGHPAGVYFIQTKQTYPHTERVVILH